MSKPPRRKEEPLFGRVQIAMAAVQGTVLLGSVLAFYAWQLGHQPPTAARCAAFIALVTGQLGLALSESLTSGAPLFHRSRIGFAAISGAAALMLVAAVAVPQLMAILRFSPPPLSVIGQALAIGCVAGGAFGIRQRVTWPRSRPRALAK